MTIDRSAPNVTVTGVLDDREFWLALRAPDLAVLPYRVVTQSGAFNCCATQEFPVLASDETCFARLERKWGVPETVDVSDRDVVVERVRTLLEDDVRRRRLRRGIGQCKRANSFDYVGRRHERLHPARARRALRRVYRRVCGEVDEGLVAPTREPDASRVDSRAAACSAQRTAQTD